MWNAISRFIRTLMPATAQNKRAGRLKPHVIIIMADQLRYDVLGKDLPLILTQLQRIGTAFGRAYCACPLCVPARGSFLPELIPTETVL